MAQDPWLILLERDRSRRPRTSTQRSRSQHSAAFDGLRSAAAADGRLSAAIPVPIVLAGAVLLLALLLLPWYYSPYYYGWPGPYFGIGFGVGRGFGRFYGGFPGFGFGIRIR